MKLKIINVGISDCDKTTIEVKCEKGKLKQTFFVQTCDSLYRQSLGCWITTADCGEDYVFSEDSNDFDDNDRIDIVDCAEAYMESIVEEVWTGHKINGEYVFLLVYSDRIDIVTENCRYINKDASSYTRKYSDVIKTFETREEAFEFLDEQKK